MNNTKETMEERFDKAYPYGLFMPESDSDKELWINLTFGVKAFIQSEIDRAVKEEREKIVGLIKNGRVVPEYLEWVVEDMIELITKNNE